MTTDRPPMGFLHRLPTPITPDVVVEPAGSVSRFDGSPKANPDVRTSGYATMVLENGCGILCNPRSIEMYSPTGKLSIFTDGNGFIYMAYVSPYSGESDILLYEGCAGEEVPLPPTTEPTDAVATRMFLPLL